MNAGVIFIFNIIANLSLCTISILDDMTKNEWIWNKIFAIYNLIMSLHLWC